MWISDTQGGRQMAVLHVTKENFEQEVLKSDKPVLVDFWASWCMPCKMLAPILDEVAEETEEFKVCKVNVDEEGDLAMQFRVMSIPTLVVMKQGEEVKRSLGVISKDEVMDLMK